MDNKKFSIIVPIYNAEKHIEKCINSVLNQTYKNFELILINDGSKDGSPKICDFYATNFKQVITIHQTNSGQLSARENGIQSASGDFCVFLDADDFLEKNALDVLSKHLDSDNYDCIIYNYQKVKNGEITSSNIRTDDSSAVYKNKRDIYKKILSSTTYNPLWIKCIKRSAFQNIDCTDFYHIRLGEDLLYSVFALNNCNKILFIPDILYNYTFNTQSITNSIDYNKYTVDFKVRYAILKFLVSENIFNENDFKEYRTSVISLLVSTIYDISVSDISHKQKIKLFKDIHNSEYYKEFIHRKSYYKISNKKRNLIFKLFDRKIFSILVFIINLHNKNNK